MAAINRRRRRRRNPANPRRRRRRNPFLPALVNRRRRRHRRNPGNGERGGLNIAGARFPAMQTIAYTTAGFVAPPFIETYIYPMLPANISGSQWGRYLIKAGSVFGLVWGTNALAGRNAAMKVATGGGVYLLSSILADFMPQITGGAVPRAAYYPRLAYARGMGAQPLLGDYGRAASMTQNAPTRLQPQNRY